jgi:hypothetical protein
MHTVVIKEDSQLQYTCNLCSSRQKASGCSASTSRRSTAAESILPLPAADASADDDDDDDDDDDESVRRSARRPATFHERARNPRAPAGGGGARGMAERGRACDAEADAVGTSPSPLVALAFDFLAAGGGDADGAGSDGSLAATTAASSAWGAGGCLRAALVRDDMRFACAQNGVDVAAEAQRSNCGYLLHAANRKRGRAATERNWRSSVVDVCSALAVHSSRGDRTERFGALPSAARAN